MTTTLDLSADLIDVRDIIARVEELRAEREMLSEEAEESSNIVTGAEENGNGDAETTLTDLRDAAESAAVNLADWNKSSDGEELTGLEAILEDLAGNGGDEQWEGVWYPVTLIADSYFETAMDELLEDIGYLPKNLPSYLTIAIDYAALQQDYTSTEIEGETYWYR